MLLEGRTRIVFVGWWLVWMGVQTVAIYSGGFAWRWALIDSGITVSIIALEAFTIVTVLRYYIPSPKSAINLLAWSAALSLAATGVIVMLVRWASPDEYDTFVQSSLMVRFAFSFFMIAFIAMFAWLLSFMKTQHEDKERQSMAEKLAREAELTTLRQQMQPHFLFNSLNSINALIAANPDRARTMVQNLSDFFRGTMRKDDGTKVTLEEEMNQLHLYLEIEKVRFGHRLKTVMDVQDECKSRLLPSLLLQPVVENAIKFGLYDTIGEVEIKVHAELTGTELLVCVENPYDPETATPRKGAGFGLSSIQRRLYLLYARNNLLTTTQENGIFKTCITIPQEQKNV
jgi:LytS/YehU family sensor histidine kinase